MSIIPNSSLYTVGNTIFGSFASRPAPGIAGRYFVPTDGYDPCRDTGTAWVTQTIPGFDNINPPSYNDAGWSQIHFTLSAGSTSIAADGDGILLSQTGNNSTSATDVSALVRAIPASGAYTLTVGFEFLFWSGAYTYAGLTVTDGNGATPKLMFCGPNQRATTEHGGRLSVWNNPSPTGGGANEGYHLQPFIGNKIFLRLTDDRSANIIYYYSFNGRFWQRFTSVGRTSYLTPAYVGVQIGQVGTTDSGALAITETRSRARIFHWSLTQ